MAGVVPSAWVGPSLGSGVLTPRPLRATAIRTIELLWYVGKSGTSFLVNMVTPTIPLTTKMTPKRPAMVLELVGQMTL